MSSTLLGPLCARPGDTDPRFFDAATGDGGDNVDGVEEEVEEEDGEFWDDDEVDEEVLLVVLPAPIGICAARRSCTSGMTGESLSYPATF